MAIDGINTGMTALQFARARAAGRTVETSLGASTGSARGGNGTVGTGFGTEKVPKSAEFGVVPAVRDAFHWSYGVAVVDGRAVARRKPQAAEGDNWSASFQRVG
ncbi:MAG: hypothetical protein ACTHN5_12000 [Phycisphaerae bacterium]